MSADARYSEYRHVAQISAAGLSRRPAAIITACQATSVQMYGHMYTQFALGVVKKFYDYSRCETFS